MAEQSEEKMSFREKNKDLLNIDFYCDYVAVLKEHYQEGRNHMQVVQAQVKPDDLQQQSADIDVIDPATNVDEKAHLEK